MGASGVEVGSVPLPRGLTGLSPRGGQEASSERKGRVTPSDLGYRVPVPSYPTCCPGRLVRRPSPALSVLLHHLPLRHTRSPFGRGDFLVLVSPRTEGPLASFGAHVGRGPSPRRAGGGGGRGARRQRAGTKLRPPAGVGPRGPKGCGRGASRGEMGVVAPSSRPASQ